MKDNRVDVSGFKKKMKLARNMTDDILPMLIEDAATFMLTKLVDEVMNGMSGSTYPKLYPASVSKNQTGFIGVITSNLRRSIGITKVSEYEIIIKQSMPSLAPYHPKMIEWSADRYGMNFYEISIKLYSLFIRKKILKKLDKLIEDIDAGKKSIYSNPF